MTNGIPLSNAAPVRAALQPQPPVQARPPEVSFLALAVALDAWAQDPQVPWAEQAARQEFRSTVLEWHEANSALPPEQTTRLSISGIEVGQIPAAIGMLQNLRELRIVCGATSVPPEIGRLQNLQTLILRNNRFTTLPADICGLPNLRTLELSGNLSLTELDQRFIELADNCRISVAATGLPQQFIDAIAAGQALRNRARVEQPQQRVVTPVPPVPHFALLPAGPLTQRVEDQDLAPGEANSLIARSIEAAQAMRRMTRQVQQATAQIDRENDRLRARNAFMENLGALAPVVLHPQPQAQPQRQPYLLTLEQRDALSTVAGEPVAHAASFAGWLDRMEGAIADQAPTVRQNMEASLRQLIDWINTDVDLRQTCFLIASLHAGDTHGAAMALNQMHEAAMVAMSLRPDATERGVIALGVGMFVLGLVRQAAVRSIAVANGQRVNATRLAFESGLCERLAHSGVALTLPTQGGIYLPGFEETHAQVLDHEASSIVARLQDLTSLQLHLRTNWPSLNSYVERVYEAQFTTLQDSFHERLEALELAANVDGAQEVSYVMQAPTLMRELQAARTQLRQRLVAEVVARNLPAHSA